MPERTYPSILSVRTQDGRIVEIPAIKGEKGDKGDRGEPGPRLVQDQYDGEYLYFWTGTRAEYEAIPEDELIGNCIYYLTDDTRDDFNTRLNNMNTYIDNVYRTVGANYTELSGQIRDLDGTLETNISPSITSLTQRISAIEPKVITLENRIIKQNTYTNVGTAKVVLHSMAGFTHIRVYFIAPNENGYMYSPALVSPAPVLADVPAPHDYYINSNITTIEAAGGLGYLDRTADIVAPTSAHGAVTIPAMYQSGMAAVVAKKNNKWNVYIYGYYNANQKIIFDINYANA